MGFLSSDPYLPTFCMTIISRDPRITIGSVRNFTTGVAGLIPGSAIFLPRTDEGHCERIHFPLTDVHLRFRRRVLWDSIQLLGKDIVQSTCERTSMESTSHRDITEMILKTTFKFYNRRYSPKFSEII